MKIVAQSQQTEDERFELTYVVVDDDAFDPLVDEHWIQAWTITATHPWLHPVFNGTALLAHGGWYPFTGDQAVLDELLADGARRPNPRSTDEPRRRYNLPVHKADYEQRFRQAPS